MTRFRNIFVLMISIVCMLAGGWLGYVLAGIVGAVFFVPVGAFVGVFIGAAPFNLLNLL